MAKCPDCGSGDVIELRPGRYVCRHSDTIFDLPHLDISIDSSCQIEACSVPAEGLCSSCGRRFCKSHQYVYYVAEYDGSRTAYTKIQEPTDSSFFRDHRIYVSRTICLPCGLNQEDDRDQHEREELNSYRRALERALGKADRVGAFMVYHWLESNQTRVRGASLAFLGIGEGLDRVQKVFSNLFKNAMLLNVDASFAVTNWLVQHADALCIEPTSSFHYVVPATRFKREKSLTLRSWKVPYDDHGSSVWVLEDGQFAISKYLSSSHFSSGEFVVYQPSIEDPDTERTLLNTTHVAAIVDWLNDKIGVSLSSVLADVQVIDTWPFPGSRHSDE